MNLNSFCEEAAQAYPARADVERWIANILNKAENVKIEGEYLDYNPITARFGNSPNTLENKYVRFHADDGRRTFYGYWQPAINQPAPLLINLPGYGGSISVHPQISDLGYNILHGRL